MTDRYVLIIENKDEEPLVMEQYLRSGTYAEIAARMASFKENPRTIRVCMAKLEFECGNRTILE